VVFKEAKNLLSLRIWAKGGRLCGQGKVVVVFLSLSRLSYLHFGS